MIGKDLVARVQGGRLVLDAETDLPDGTEVPLAPREQLQRPLCNVLLFVTTPTERDTLKDVAAQMGIEDKTIQGNFSDYLDLGKHGPYRVFGVHTEMGALQAGGSATKGLLCPVETSARYVIAVGTAFGIDRAHQKFGDVLVATHVVPYDFVLVDTDSDGRLPRISYNNAKPNPSNPALIALLRRFAGHSHTNFNVHFGAMLSGSAQIRCGAYRDHLRSKFDKKLTDLDKQSVRKKGQPLTERIIGGEMEGVGLLATPTKEGAASWLIVKGISDFADEEHNSENERERVDACKNAVEFVLKALASHASDVEKEIEA